MKIEEMTNKELQKNYALLLIEIENQYSTKKEFETEFKRRLREGVLENDKS